MNPLDAAQEQGFSRLVVSRASDLDVSEAEIAVTFAPVVAGRTVWEAAPASADTAVYVEDPNFFGRTERDPQGDATVLRTARRDWSAADLRTSRHLAASLNQIAGMRLPHGQPEAPWFVASLPNSAARTVAALDEAGYQGCRALERQFPEFPGGVRIAVAWPERANAQFCTIVRTVI